MSSKSNLKKIRGTFLLGSTVAGVVGTAAASVSAQEPGIQTTKNFFEGAKSWGSKMVSGAKDLGAIISEGVKSFGNAISSKASNAKEYISENFNKFKNTSFGKAVSEVTNPVANFVKAHPYASVALSVVAVVGLYKLFKKRTGTEVNKRGIATIVSKNGNNQGTHDDIK